MQNGTHQEKTEGYLIWPLQKFQNHEIAVRRKKMREEG
jgi:hypothetical protein